MNWCTRVWLALPLVVGLAVLVAWLSVGRGEVGWRMVLPCIVLVPMWADVGQKMVAPAGGGVERWQNFPGSAHAVTALVVVVYAALVAPSTLPFAEPDVNGRWFDRCDADGTLHLANTTLDIAELLLRGDLPSGAGVDGVDVWWSQSGCQSCAMRRVYHTAEPDAAARPPFHLPTSYPTADLEVRWREGNTSRAALAKGVTLNDQAQYAVAIQAEGTPPAAVVVTTLRDNWSYTKPIWAAALSLIAVQVIYAAITTIVAEYIKLASAPVRVWTDEEAGRFTPSLRSGDGGASYASVCTAIEHSIPSAKEMYTKLQLMWLEPEEIAAADESAPLVAGDSPADVAKPPKTTRLASLDVMRGMSLAVMNFVNVGGGGYWFFNHSAWSGLTLADLVFPWFIWVMGVAMALSLESTRIRHNKAAAALHIAKRAALLYLIGVFLGASDGPFRGLRLTGVLNRFGMSYFAVGMALLFVPKKVYAADDAHATELKRRLVGSVCELPVFATIAVVWLALTYALLVTVDGVDCTGYVGPGGVGDHGDYAPCTGGAAAYIDKKMFGSGLDGPSHRYGGCTAIPTYTAFDLRTMTCTPLRLNDPEGLLGTLNSIVLCWLGVVLGRMVRADPVTKLPARKKMVIICAVAYTVVFGMLGGGLAAFSQDDGPVPVNKNLWTTSFVMVLAATGALFLLVLMMLVDWSGVWEGKPFLFVGMNSMLFYFFSEIFEDLDKPPFTLLPPLATHAHMMVEDIIQVAVPAMAAYWLWRNKLFFKL